MRPSFTDAGKVPLWMIGMRRIASWSDATELVPRSKRRGAVAITPISPGRKLTRSPRTMSRSGSSRTPSRLAAT